MSQKHTLEFQEATSPITSPVTKFGGQPHWIAGAQWPLSRSTGNPMRFIGQIALDRQLFPNTSAKMAYLFMTDEEDGQYVDGTWEPNGGENAVVLQPGNFAKPTRELAEGPTLYQMVEQPGADRLTRQTVEYSVTLVPGEDAAGDDAEENIEENKIGGRPCFLQGEEYPFDDETPLLLQLDSGSVPFSVNFGDVGVGYAFLNADGTEAKFLWQCG